MNVVPAAGVIFALNLYSATSRAELAGSEKSTAANISAVKESTDAKIDASNKILYGYTSILDRMSKDASSKQQ